jgi:hypothetical protein
MRMATIPMAGARANEPIMVHRNVVRRPIAGRIPPATDPDRS